MTDREENSPRPARFIIVPHFIYEQLKGNEKLVYLSLAYHADEEGYSWPSHETIAGETGLSRRTVVDTMKLLMAREGFRTVRRHTKSGNRSSNGYYIPLWKQ